MIPSIFNLDVGYLLHHQAKKSSSQVPSTQSDNSAQLIFPGVSGRFPASNNVQEFRDGLFNKKDMFDAIDKRWKVDNSEIPPKGGLIPEINKFDPGFFGIHHRQATNMDPAMRNFIEVAIESIMDAGIHPKELEGSKTGVFVGYSWSDLEAPSLSEADEPQKFRMTGYVIFF